VFDIAAQNPKSESALSESSGGSPHHLIASSFAKKTGWMWDLSSGREGVLAFANFG